MHHRDSEAHWGVEVWDGDKSLVTRFAIVNLYLSNRNGPDPNKLLLRVQCDIKS